MLSPDFPPLCTVHEIFTSHGAPSGIQCFPKVCEHNMLRILCYAETGALPASLRKSFSFFRLLLSRSIGRRYLSMVSCLVACISWWTSTCTMTKFAYRSVPPCLLGVLWWQWISPHSNTRAVTAHFPYCAQYKDSRLSIYSILRLHSLARISIWSMLTLMPRFLWISARPSGV